MPFRPGQSGNPGGRPKGLAARVRELVNLEELVPVLVEIVLAPESKDKDRIQACALLFDRGWGKAHQSLTIDADVRSEVMDALAMTPEQRKRRIAELEAKRLALTEPEPDGGADPSG